MRYLLRRLGLLLVTGWAALTLNYVLPQLVPGDPVSVMLARYQGRLSPRAADALREAFGLNTDKSWFAQYLDYWRRMLTGDFGLSLGFHNADQPAYLAMVRAYAGHYRLPLDEADALAWAIARGGRSGRVAWQYTQDVAGRSGVKLDS